MIEFSFTILFDSQYWEFGIAYPETDGAKGGYPAQGLVIQLWPISIQITLYKTWEVQEND